MGRVGVLIVAIVIAGCGTSTGQAPGWTYPAPSAQPVATASAGGGSPIASRPVPASPSPQASAAWAMITSSRFRYLLSVPADWRYVPATEDWPDRVYPSAVSAFSDRFTHPSDSFPAIDISTQVLAPGTTPADFLTWLSSEDAKICEIHETEDVVVDGATGRFQRQSCGYNAWEVAVFDEDRVYLLFWLGLPARIDEDRRMFQAVLDSFRFAPQR